VPCSPTPTSLTRGQRQQKYKKILVAHGLQITGEERYNKATEEDVDEDTDGAAAATAVPAKRKTNKDIAGGKKVVKKPKTDGNDAAGEEDEPNGK
jgi:hypothetical protein